MKQSSAKFTRPTITHSVYLFWYNMLMFYDDSIVMLLCIGMYYATLNLSTYLDKLTNLNGYHSVLKRLFHNVCYKI